MSCVLDKGWLAGGNTARNTTIIRANYLTPEGVAFYKESVELFRGLSVELDINVMYSERGHFTLAHTDAAMRTARWRAEVNKHLGVNSEVIGPDEIKRLCPTMNMSDDVRYPILGALYHPPGRHRAPRRASPGATPRRRCGAASRCTPRPSVNRILIENGRAVGVETNRGVIHAGKVVQAVAGASSRGGAHGRLPAADPHHPAAGLRVGAGEADPRPDHRVGLAARLHLAIGARRDGDGRRRPTPTGSIPRARRSTSRKA